MFNSHCALVLFTGLALVAGSSALLADPGKGKGKGGLTQLLPTQQEGKGGHGTSGGVLPGQAPQNGNRWPAGGKPSRDAQGGAPQWGGVEQDKGKGKGGDGWSGDSLPRQGSQHGSQPWPGGNVSRGERDGTAQGGDFRIDSDRVRGVIGESRGYWSPGPGLPPGIRKNLQRGKPLPPGIARQQLDSRLVNRLPNFPGFEWARVGSDLVQLSTSTGAVNQVLSGMFD